MINIKRNWVRNLKRLFCDLYLLVYKKITNKWRRDRTESTCPLLCSPVQSVIQDIHSRNCRRDSSCARWGVHQQPNSFSDKQKTNGQENRCGRLSLRIYGYYASNILVDSFLVYLWWVYLFNDESTTIYFSVFVISWFLRIAHHLEWFTGTSVEISHYCTANINWDISEYCLRDILT